MGAARLMKEGARQVPDWVGRGVGLAVFGLGIILLVYVFFATNQLGSLLPPAGEKIPPSEWALRLGAPFIVELGKLFISGLIASWIAARGAQMYAAAGRALPGE
ncbi:MAG: hypothetical protein ACK47B_16110 [Armatimonadota bacterium]